MRAFELSQDGLGRRAYLPWLESRAANDERKIVLAGILRAKTSVSNEWIATMLVMGHPGSVSRMLSAGCSDKDLAMKRSALAQILYPDEKFVQ